MVRIRKYSVCPSSDVTLDTRVDALDVWLDFCVRQVDSAGTQVAYIYTIN